MFNMKKIFVIVISCIGTFVLYRLLFSFVLFSSFSSFGWLNSKEFFPKYVLLNPLKECELYSMVNQCVEETKEIVMSDTVFVNNVSAPNGNPRVRYSSDNLEKLKFYRFFLADTLPIKIESIKEDGDCLMILIVKEWGDEEWQSKSSMLKYCDFNSYEWIY